ncbi:histidine--tRNA ligase [soil metagenome]
MPNGSDLASPGRTDSGILYPDVITKPRSPKGVLELLPSEQAIHDAMLDTIRSGYRRFGFLPIETPVFELSDVLLTKGGGETERQVYFVQSAGAMAQESAPDLALRFDLTVPLARYVAQHEHQLTFPFRRSQIQRVYRGERPQRGRYREFYQCDIDVLDRDDLSLRHDAEVAAAMIEILSTLQIGTVTMRLNNRRLMRSLLSGVDVTNATDQADVLREIDKQERDGSDRVRAALVAGGMTPAGANRLLELTTTTATGPDEILATLDDLAGGEAGSEELKQVVLTMRDMGVPPERYSLDLSIARGLDYYTGTVYETVLDDHRELGSICSGGRYDDLASQYTKTRLPGVGLSIGFTRLFWQLREAALLPGHTAPIEVSVLLLDDGGLPYALDVAQRLRDAGISTAISLEPDKLDRQLKNAGRSGVRFAAIAGDEERSLGTVTIKDLAGGHQVAVSLADVATHVRSRMSSGADTTS